MRARASNHEGVAHSLSVLVLDAEMHVAEGEAAVAITEAKFRILGACIAHLRVTALRAGIPVSPSSTVDETAQTVDVPKAILVDADKAATLLGVTKTGLYTRVSRGQVAGVVRTGRRVQFHEDKLLASLERRASK